MQIYGFPTAMKTSKTQSDYRENLGRKRRLQAATFREKREFFVVIIMRPEGSYIYCFGLF